MSSNKIIYKPIHIAHDYKKLCYHILIRDTKKLGRELSTSPKNPPCTGASWKVIVLDTYDAFEISAMRAALSISEENKVDPQDILLFDYTKYSVNSITFNNDHTTRLPLANIHLHVNGKYNEGEEDSSEDINDNNTVEVAGLVKKEKTKQIVVDDMEDTFGGEFDYNNYWFGGDTNSTNNLIGLSNFPDIRMSMNCMNNLEAHVLRSNDICFYINLGANSLESEIKTKRSCKCKGYDITTIISAFSLHNQYKDNNDKRDKMLYERTMILNQLSISKNKERYKFLDSVAGYNRNGKFFFVYDHNTKFNGYDLIQLFSNTHTFISGLHRYPVKHQNICPTVGFGDSEGINILREQLQKKDKPIQNDHELIMVYFRTPDNDHQLILTITSYILKIVHYKGFFQICGSTLQTTYSDYIHEILDQYLNDVIIYSKQINKHSNCEYIETMLPTLACIDLMYNGKIGTIIHLNPNNMEDIMKTVLDKLIALKLIYDRPYKKTNTKNNVCKIHFDISIMRETTTRNQLSFWARNERPLHKFIMNDPESLYSSLIPLDMSLDVSDNDIVLTKMSFNRRDFSVLMIIMTEILHTIENKDPKHNIYFKKDNLKPSIHTLTLVNSRAYTETPRNISSNSKLQPDVTHKVYSITCQHDRQPIVILPYEWEHFSPKEREQFYNYIYSTNVKTGLKFLLLCRSLYPEINLIGFIDPETPIVCSAKRKNVGDAKIIKTENGLVIKQGNFGKEIKNDTINEASLDSVTNHIADPNKIRRDRYIYHLHKDIRGLSLLEKNSYTYICFGIMIPHTLTIAWPLFIAEKILSITFDKLLINLIEHTDKKTDDINTNKIREVLLTIQYIRSNQNKFHDKIDVSESFTTFILDYLIKIHRIILLLFSNTIIKYLSIDVIDLLNESQQTPGLYIVHKDNDPKSALGLIGYIKDIRKANYNYNLYERINKDRITSLFKGVQSDHTSNWIYIMLNKFGMKIHGLYVNQRIHIYAIIVEMPKTRHKGFFPIKSEINVYTKYPVYTTPPLLDNNNLLPMHDVLYLLEYFKVDIQIIIQNPITKMYTAFKTTKVYPFKPTLYLPEKILDKYYIENAVDSSEKTSLKELERVFELGYLYNYNKLAHTQFKAILVHYITKNLNKRTRKKIIDIYEKSIYHINESVISIQNIEEQITESELYNESNSNTTGIYPLFQLKMNVIYKEDQDKLVKNMLNSRLNACLNNNIFMFDIVYALEKLPKDIDARLNIFTKICKDLNIDLVDKYTIPDYKINRKSMEHSFSPEGDQIEKNKLNDFNKELSNDTIKKSYRLVLYNYITSE